MKIIQNIMKVVSKQTQSPEDDSKKIFNHECHAKSFEAVINRIISYGRKSFNN